jgi:hypothetical protein
MDADFQKIYNMRLAEALRQQPPAMMQGMATPNIPQQNMPQQNPSVTQMPFYPPSYYQMNPQIPIPVDYPYVIQQR